MGVVRAAIELVRDAVRAGTVSAAHDASDGGLACAIAECCIAGGVGVDCDLDPLVELRAGSGETWLFGEGPGGFILAGAHADLEPLTEVAGASGVDLVIVGEAGGDRIVLSAAEAELSIPLADAERAWRSLGERMGETVPA